ncbi:MAG TPA: ABC transporter permease [Actinophytocola sp.]|uniref:ABC transporter permease n=1 Tax=Actinophytocola sp. TaxID=1872138 RepID=UPI002DB813D7|nr:ABC transporter permease [Actinophytocola sp.]HEU5470663.1 ABC transporter permease [Actinophytocola sp.]
MRAGRADRARLGIAAPRLRPGDLARESWLSVTRFPGRSLLTALGTLLAAAAFVSTLGLVSTLSQQVSSAFDLRRATEVVVKAEDPGLDNGWQHAEPVDRLRRLAGVVAAGPRVTLAERPVTRLAGGSGGPAARIMGADPEALRVLAPNLVQGRLFTAFDESAAARLVLLPRALAGELGLHRTQAAVFIDDRAYTVAGIYDDVRRRPEALHSVIMPFSTANRLADATPDAERDIVVETAPGAAQLIGHQAPLALHPAAPDALRAIAPPDPRTLRREVESDLARSTLLISAISLVIGTVSIGNAATASIAARRAEIGLRRAVGARRRHIFTQLLCETTVLGALSGTAGAFLGLAVTAGVSLWNGWLPVIDPGTALRAAGCCAAAGLLAGLLPALRATRVQPVTALQR